MKKNIKNKALAMLSVSSILLSQLPINVYASDFTNHWAGAVIQKWQDSGLIKGYVDGTFKPDKEITRAEFVIMLNKAMGLTDEGNISFKDLKPEHWFYKDIAIATKAGYCNGYEDGTFRPKNIITRAEAAVMIARIAKLDTNASTNKFKDSEDIPLWAKGSVGAVVNAGFMGGYPDGSFGARNKITRAETVSSLDRVKTKKDNIKDDVIIEEDKVEDYIIEDEYKVEDKVITGNLSLGKDVDNKKVYVTDTTVNGDFIVKYAKDNSIYLKDSEIKGKVILDEETYLELSKDTKINELVINNEAEITTDDFKGEIDTIVVDTSRKVIIDVPVKNVIVKDRANLDIKQDVQNLEVNEDAKDSKIYIDRRAEVDTLVADSQISILGSGDIKTLEANESGIKYDEDLYIKDIDTAKGVRNPTKITHSSSGGSGGGSSTPTVTYYDVTIKNIDSKYGSATLNKTRAKYDDDIVLAVTSNAGYSIKEVSYIYSGVDKKIITPDVNGEYKFKMPRNSVSIEVVYESEILITQNIPATAPLQEHTRVSFSIKNSSKAEYNGKVTINFNGTNEDKKLLLRDIFLNGNKINAVEKLDDVKLVGYELNDIVVPAGQTVVINAKVTPDVAREYKIQTSIDSSSSEIAIMKVNPIEETKLEITPTIPENTELNKDIDIKYEIANIGQKDYNGYAQIRTMDSNEDRKFTLTDIKVGEQVAEFTEHTQKGEELPMPEPWQDGYKFLGYNIKLQIPAGQKITLTAKGKAIAERTYKLKILTDFAECSKNINVSAATKSAINITQKLPVTVPLQEHTRVSFELNNSGKVEYKGKVQIIIEGTEGPNISLLEDIFLDNHKPTIQKTKQDSKTIFEISSVTIPVNNSITINAKITPEEAMNYKIQTVTDAGNSEIATVKVNEVIPTKVNIIQTIPGTANVNESKGITIKLENTSDNEYNGNAMIRFQGSNVNKTLTLTNIKVEGETAEFTEHTVKKNESLAIQEKWELGDEFLGYNVKVKIPAKSTITITANAQATTVNEYKIKTLTDFNTSSTATMKVE